MDAAVSNSGRRKIAGLWNFKLNILDSMVAESFALFKALEMTRNKGWNRIVCESDAQSVIKFLCGIYSCSNWKCEGIKLFMLKYKFKFSKIQMSFYY